MQYIQSKVSHSLSESMFVYVLAYDDDIIPLKKKRGKPHHASALFAMSKAKANIFHLWRSSACGSHSSSIIISISIRNDSIAFIHHTKRFFM